MRGCLICPLQHCSYNTHRQGTPQAPTFCTKATSFFCSRPGFYWFHLLLLRSCSWGNQQVYSYPPSLSMLTIILQIFTIFFQLSLLQAEFQLIPWPLCSSSSVPCLNLRLFQVFCIFWDEWQERSTENWRCGITIDWYSIIIMLWFVFYFLPNTS